MRLKAHKHLAQGNALGKRAYNADALKEQKNSMTISSFSMLLPFQGGITGCIVPGVLPRAKRVVDFQPTTL